MPFIDLAELEEKEVAPGFHGKFAHGEKMTLSRWRIEEGATLPEHAHPHEQLSIIIEGKFEMRLDGETRRIEAGKVAVIPSNVKHSGTALTDCTILDIFHPVREEYR